MHLFTFKYLSKALKKVLLSKVIATYGLPTMTCVVVGTLEERVELIKSFTVKKVSLQFSFEQMLINS